MYKDDFFNRIKEKLVSHTSSEDKKEDKYIKSLTGELKRNVEVNNLLWDIPASENITSHRKVIGKLIVLCKKVVRKLLFWFVTKPLIQQKEFNASVTRSLNEIFNLQQLYISKLEEITHLKSNLSEKDNLISNQMQQISNLSRQINNLNKQIEGLNLKYAELSKISNSLVIRDSFPVDYKKFEDQFRGSEADIKKQQVEIYSPYLEGKKKLLDLGCGRGELVAEFYNLGFDSLGVELDNELVNYARNKGLNVVEGDMIEFLNNSTQKFDAITCLHVIEHLYPYQIVELVRSASNCLEEDGLIIFETPNPECLYNLAYGFSIDMTHKKPVHAYTMRFLFEEAGLCDIKIKHLEPTSSSVSLEKFRDNDQGNENIDKLNNLLFGYQNYAIIGRKARNEKDPNLLSSNSL